MSGVLESFSSTARAVVKVSQGRGAATRRNTATGMEEREMVIKLGTDAKKVIFFSMAIINAVCIILFIHEIASALIENEFSAFVIVALFMLIMLTIALDTIFIICLQHQYIVSKDGIVSSVFNKRIVLRTYSWNDFEFVGVITVLGKGRIPTQKRIVCSSEQPCLAHKGGTAYYIPQKGSIIIEFNEQNKLIMRPYFSGQKTD